MPFADVSIQLSKGIKIALGPAVLGMIYRDLRVWKAAMVSLNQPRKGVKLTMSSPFHLIQLWAWERISNLSPEANPLGISDPRMLRWDNVKSLKIQNMRLTLESVGDTFKWRPYAIPIEGWNFPHYYAEQGMYQLVGPESGEEWLSFFRCFKGF